MGKLKGNNSDAIKGVSGSKVEKKKLKNKDKNLKNKLENKTIDADTVAAIAKPAMEATNGLSKKLKKKKDKTPAASQVVDTETVTTATKPATEATNAKSSKKFKNKKNKTPADPAAAAAVTSNEAAPAKKELTEADLAKIAKKKAKKEAQKLRKKQKAEEGAATKATTETPKGAAGKKLKNNNKQQPKTVAPSVKPFRDPEDEAATVFVGNLPVNTKGVQIKKLFKDFVVKRFRIRSASGKMLFKHKQRLEAGSLNAYVVLDSPEAAERALALNGTEFKSRHLRVTKSLEVPGKHSQLDVDKKCTVLVGNLKSSVNEEQLREIFSSCGQIKYVRCIQSEKGCKGIAYVCFESKEAVGLALELEGTMLEERPIHVEMYKVEKLGAKAKRDKEAEVAKKFTGAQKRLNDKKKHVQNNNAEGNNDKKQKKSEYRGVKVAEGTTGGIKKKQKKKQKFNPMMKLAQKLAPKENKKD